MSPSATVKKLAADLDLSAAQEIAIMIWLLANRVVIISENELIGMIDKAFDDAKKNMEAKTIQ